MNYENSSKKWSLNKYLIIFKAWSESNTKPLSQQTPKSNKNPPKRKKEGFGPWADTKITWATNIPNCSFQPPTHPITFKHEGVLWEKRANFKSGSESSE